MEIRHDWQTEEVEALLSEPLLPLLDRARQIHRRFHPPDRVQLATLCSIKTGGCPEDCAYCSQSVHYSTGVKPEPLMSVEEVVERARRAKERGATRFCMGAAYRTPPPGRTFDRICEMVREVAALGLETCLTAGMLTREQAFRLKEAGLTAYNHNIDTSPEYYSKIITTRTFADRLRTLEYVREAGLKVCCGGILGMGESRRDRARMLEVLANFDPHPESVPINLLVPIPGTPLEDAPPVSPLELVRTIAVARILMPTSYIRLSAGRKTLSPEAQTLAFLAGANSIFYGEKLLTTPNAEAEEDKQLLKELGLTPLAPYEGTPVLS